MLDDLLNDRPGLHQKGVPKALPDASSDRGVNFTMFLTMMGEHLFEFDTEAELIEAFECFDENDSGLVKCDEVQRWLSEVGERMDQSEVRLTCGLCKRKLTTLCQIDRLLKGPFTDRHGNFNYREWVKVLRVNAETEDTE
jgi:myosin regulatory light chain 12